jgi:hypothetical protein
MTSTLSESRASFASALVQAEMERSRATREAEVEYSETVAKLREQFEFELAEAAARRRRAVLPAHRAYNTAVIQAERVLITILN